MPDDLLLICQRDVCKMAGVELTDAEYTAKVIAGMLKNKTKGIVSCEQIKTYFDKSEVYV